MPLKIRRSAKARADQSAIWLYIADDSMTAADMQIDRLHEAIGMLAEFPEAGRIRPEFGSTLRGFPVDQ